MLTNVLQPTHLIIVLVVGLLFLGPKRLPDAGRALGQGIREFKHSISGTDDGSASAQVTAEPKTQVAPALIPGRLQKSARPGPRPLESPGDSDLDVDRRDWDTTYGPELDA